MLLLGHAMQQRVNRTLGAFCIIVFYISHSLRLLRVFSFIFVVVGCTTECRVNIFILSILQGVANAKHFARLLQE